MTAIVPMTTAHLDDVCAIESHSFSTPWPMEDILFELRQEHSICLVAMINGKLVGYTIMRHIVNEGHICNIAVHEDYRKKGIGSALLVALIKKAEVMEMMGLTLEVRIGNRAAMALYHKFGFKVEGYRRGYYKNPKEDAAIMWKYVEEVYK